MQTYLVTGGAGFIGANYILYLLRTHEDIRVINIDRLTYAGNLENLKSIENDERYTFIKADICDTKSMRQILSETPFDYIVNFAAESHVDRSIEDPLIFANTNILGTVNLLQLCLQEWKKKGEPHDKFKFLQVSTDEVYGSLGSEGFFTEKTPLDPHSPYSASKASADLLVKAYFDTYKMPVNITRCSNNYGPYQHPEKLIPLMINNALQHKPLPVYGDGMQVRDWLYVEDHCRALDMVLRGGTAGEVYNIGGHNECANIHLVKKILRYLRDNVDHTIDEMLIRHVEDRKGHDRRYAIDPEKIKRDIGWKPQTRYEEGLEKTICWYLENKDWVADIVNGEYQNYYAKTYEERLK